MISRYPGGQNDNNIYYLSMEKKKKHRPGQRRRVILFAHRGAESKVCVYKNFWRNYRQPRAVARPPAAGRPPPREHGTNYAHANARGGWDGGDGVLLPPPPPPSAAPYDVYTSFYL